MPSRKLQPVERISAIDADPNRATGLAEASSAHLAYLEDEKFDGIGQ
jgi:hypothetical protein